MSNNARFQPVTGLNNHATAKAIADYEGKATVI
jgi:hypothetical protein